MATLPDALAELTAAVDARRSFKLEAGAGSGKTFALIHVLHHLLDTQRSELRRAGRVIACITYTNAARDEIRSRIADDPLVRVSTIHDFLWNLMERHQAALREELVLYNKELKKPFEDLESLDTTPVVYSDRGRWFPEGQISHDDVIQLSKRMISKYSKLARLAADHYPYILVDEYQDTFPETIDLLLDGLLAAREGRIVIGLFGDSMQKIYSTGVGAVDDKRLQIIVKHENYRSSRPVLNLLNKIRPELPQRQASRDEDGEALLFLNADEPTPEVRVESAKQSLIARGWSLDDTKHLYLTHRLIARNLQYPRLLHVYDQRGFNGRDDLFEDREAYAQVLSRITVLRQAFEANDYATMMEVLGETKLKITRHSQKRELSAVLKEIAAMPTTTNIGAVLDRASDLRLVAKPAAARRLEAKPTDQLDERDLRDLEFIKELREIPFQEWLNFVEFREQRTPYSTQHGVKGAEFDDVLVVVDDAAWNQYNMAGMMAGTDSNQSRVQRSRNMFYVCCSRARRRLAVVFVSDFPPQALATAHDWFGPQNVI